MVTTMEILVAFFVNSFLLMGHFCKGCILQACFHLQLPEKKIRHTMLLSSIRLCHCYYAFFFSSGFYLPILSTLMILFFSLFLAMKQGRRNSVVVTRDGFNELYMFSPGSTHECYSKYTYICVGQSAVLTPIILGPEDVWSGGQHLHNPNL